MPPRNRNQETPQDRANRRRQMRLMLKEMGVRVAPFLRFVELALRNRWNADLFLMEIRASRPFRRQFPGIPDTWDVSQYREYDRQIRDLAADYGIPISRARVGKMAAKQKSPQEAAMLFSVEAFVRGPEGKFELDRINMVLTQKERKKLDRVGFARLLLGKADADVADIYESAVMASSGIGLGGREAREIARHIGQPGQVVDIAAIVQRVRARRDQLMPELRRAGISEVDLTLLEGGQDPRGIGPTVERIERTRANVAAASGRQSAQQGVAGVTLGPAEDEGR